MTIRKSQLVFLVWNTETNTIDIKVQAPDRRSSQSYILNAFRPVVLDDLGIQGLIPTFNPFERNYRVTIPNRDETPLTITPMTPDGIGITYTISEQAEGAEPVQQPENTPATISFMEGDTKVITIAVKAPEPNETTNTYVVRATREESSDVRLQAPPTVGGVAAVVDPNNPLRYVAELAFDVAMATITAVANSNFAKAVTIMAVGGDELGSGVQRASGSVTLANPGASTTLTIVVTAQNGSTQPYTLVVRRLNDDATLRDITLAGKGVPEVTVVPGRFDYSLSVGNEFDTTTVTATVTDPGARSSALLRMTR